MVAARCGSSSRNGRNVLSVPRRRPLVRPRDDLRASRPRRTCAARASTRRAGASRWSRNLRVFGYVFNPASFYLCRDAGRASCGSSSSRSTTPTASATSTRSGRATRARPASSPRWTRRSTSRRSSTWTARYTVRVQDEAGAPAHRHQRASRATGRCWPRAWSCARRPLTDRMLAADAPPPSARDPQDDRVDPLARLAAVAARRPLPPALGEARPVTHRRRIRRCRPRLGAHAVEPLLASVAWRARRSARGRVAHPRRAPDGACCPTARGGSSATGSADRGRDAHPRPGGAAQAAARRRDRRRRGVHGRPVVQPGPARRSSRSRRSIARRWRCRRAGGAPAPGPRTVAHRRRRNTQGRSAPQHRRPLRPRQRLLPAVARRDDDLLERRLRVAATRRSPTRSAPSTGAWPSGAGLEPGQHVLEIGTGWGGFALYAAGELGCRVTTDHHLAGAARPGARAGRRGRA